MIIETDRLILRRPEERDFEGFKALMTDQEAAQFIGGTLHEDLIWRQMCTLIGHWEVRGYGFFSMEEKATGEWVGRTGPWFPHGFPGQEVGWSVVRAHWGKGYALEAAVASMNYVFDTLNWPRVIHSIDPKNVGSQAVAKKLGSYDTGEDFLMEIFDITVDVWGQTREEWAHNRKAF